MALPVRSWWTASRTSSLPLPVCPSVSSLSATISFRVIPKLAAAFPSWDISLNYIPIPYPDYPPAVIPMKADSKQLWRLVNASADTILDIQLQYDGTPQPLKVVALDGVPTGSQDGSRHGKIVTKTDILLPPAARAEFIVTAPKKGVQNATLADSKYRHRPRW